MNAHRRCWSGAFAAFPAAVPWVRDSAIMSDRQRAQPRPGSHSGARSIV